MLKYYEPRLQVHRENLKQIFSSSKRELKISISKATDALPESQKITWGILKEIFDDFYGPRQVGSATTRLDCLVRKAFAVRELKSARADMENILNSAALAKGIYTCICFLGRLRAAHRTFLTLAATSRAFAQIQIYTVRVPKPIRKNYKSLNLAQTFSLLGLELSDFCLQETYQQEHKPEKGSNGFCPLTKSEFVHSCGGSACIFPSGKSNQERLSFRRW